jgi:hypothetical protein
MLICFDCASLHGGNNLLSCMILGRIDAAGALMQKLTDLELLKRYSG